MPGSKPKPIAHGTDAGYQQHLRQRVPICDECRKARRDKRWAQYRKKGGKRKRPTPVKRPHGHLTRFRRGCRCRRCKAAHAAYLREWRALRKRLGK